MRQADKINRKLDMSCWRSFIAVARRRIRMEAPPVVDAEFLHQIACDAVQEQDLRATDVPDRTDLELLLASRALDDDWLTRPSLVLLPDDLLVLQCARHMHEHAAAPPCSRASAVGSGPVRDEQEKLAPGFSVLHHVAHGKPPAQEPAQPEPTPDAAADLFAQRHPLDQHTVSLMPCCGHSH